MVARPALPNLDTLPPEALKVLILTQQQTLAVQAEEIRSQLDAMPAVRLSSEAARAEQ